MKPVAKLRSGLTKFSIREKSRPSIEKHLIKPVKIQKPKPPPGATLENFASKAYAMLGLRIVFLYPKLEGLKPRLESAGIRVGYKPYVSLMALLSVIGASVAFPVSFFFILIFSLAVKSVAATFPSPIAIVAGSLGIGILVGAGTFGISFLYPMMKIMSRRSRMDAFLSHTASYMAVLATAGVTPEKILRSIAGKDPKYLLSEEATAIVAKIDMLGFDIISAIDTEIKASPSRAYANFMKGYATTIRTGGDLKKYLLTSAQQLLRQKSLLLKRFMDTMVMLAEIYVIMLIAFPLFLIVMLSVMGMVGTGIGGVGPFQMMYFIAFIMLPVLGLMFLVWLDAIQPKG